MEREYQSQQIHKVDTLGQMSTEERNAFGPRLGDIGEHFVCAMALYNGAEVYKNISGVGPADLVIKPKETGLLYEIDVKTASWNKEKGSWEADNTHRVKPPQWAVAFIPEKDNPHIRWPYIHGGDNRGNRPFKCPPGLEDFWNS